MGADITSPVRLHLRRDGRWLRHARARRLLGRVVRAVQDDRPDARGDRLRAQGQAPDRQAQRRRQPAHGAALQRHEHPDADGVQRGRAWSSGWSGAKGKGQLLQDLAEFIALSGAAPSAHDRGPTVAARRDRRGGPGPSAAARRARARRLAGRAGRVRPGHRRRRCAPSSSSAACASTGSAARRRGRRSSRAGSRWATGLLYFRQPMLRGDDVAELQRQLNSLGFDAGREDGILGEQTADAVAEFQRNVGLAPDGFCGWTTVAALRRVGTLAGGSVASVREREMLRRGPAPARRQARLHHRRPRLRGAGRTRSAAGSPRPAPAHCWIRPVRTTARPPSPPTSSAPRSSSRCAPAPATRAACARTSRPGRSARRRATGWPPPSRTS